MSDPDNATTTAAEPTNNASGVPPPFLGERVEVGEEQTT